MELFENGHAKTEVMEMSEQDQKDQKDQQQQKQEGKQNPQLEQNQKEKPMSVISKALVTGFIGGVLWSFIGTVAYFFNFSTVSAGSFVIRSFVQNEWSSRWLGELIAILAVGLISLLIAILYFGLLKNTKGLWPSMAFGAALWFIVFFLFQPVFSAVPSLGDLDSDTIVTSLCLFILYGAFIGYSISYDYQQNNQPS
ncbi:MULTISPECIES: YqhR family membrane protein [Pontibacillus]|uniref:YqhR family membrane protein n=1 Tax=Pontibacillus chungwhensis TaxID=265426 RepID=A0ABY8UVX3_9BACI|nr:MULTISPECIES: YqhR family membrane protein [Pontibacillus]WIF96901.1 YqhR family membrane protein [Pontibacillus chungwhensis]